MLPICRLLCVLVAWSMLVGTVGAQPQPESTRAVVRAVSNDAKLLPDPVGGAFIRIVNAETGAMLAEGGQRGASGSTATIMRRPHERGA